jgi:hypothetical protein
VEIWGYDCIEVIERVQLKFLKCILKMKRSTSNYMVYGETGCLPLSIDINERIIMFLARLKKHAANNHQKKLLSLLYMLYEYVIDYFYDR